MKQFVKSLHWTLIIKVLSKGKAEAVWTGGYLAKQKWSGKGQKMATLEGRRSLRKCSFLSRALKHGTREVPSRIWLKVSKQLSLWILSNQEHGWNTRFSSSFSLAVGGVTIVEQERGGVSWSHTSHKGSWLSSPLPGDPRLLSSWLWVDGCHSCRRVAHAPKPPKLEWYCGHSTVSCSEDKSRERCCNPG